MAPTLTLDPTNQQTDVDLLDLDVTVITEAGGDHMAAACGTSDGCQSTCASSCTSAV